MRTETVREKFDRSLRARGYADVTSYVRTLLVDRPQGTTVGEIAAQEYVAWVDALPGFDSLAVADARVVRTMCNLAAEDYVADLLAALDDGRVCE